MEFSIKEIAGIVVLVIVFLIVIFKAIWLLINYLKESQTQNKN